MNADSTSLQRSPEPLTLVMTIDILINPGSVVTPLRPLWFTYFTLSVPLGDRNFDAIQLATAVTFAFRIQINLYTLFNGQSRIGRNFGVQTASIYISYSYPLYQAEQTDGTINTVALSNMGVGLVFFVAALLGEPTTSSRRASRSIQEDQLDLFRQIEDNIATMGLDGHACILRFICEMQTNRFSSSSIFGEIFSLVFTPKPGEDYILLKDYIAAEMAGQEADRTAGPTLTCAERYLTCPVSVFAFLRHIHNGLGFSTQGDRPLNATSSNLQENLILPMDSDL
ncbi:putative DM4/DM12 family-like protein 7 [Homarus americanus]|uniref:Putative DM4/DM12 family-like protein 7 n=1 Tax=Homarus americanus TaxID=6706 RepID=A0A8J5K1J6_HOMAM|nr:putative DM4/DM12 family-like protein 7 [Homarus americanus]